MKGFLGITCHFILNWSMYSLMLECKRFKGRHTAENIYSYYCEATTSYNIKGKVITTVTDNASNVVKAFSIPGYHGDLQDYDEDEEEDEGEMNATDLHDSLDYVSQHDTCFAHTLQLVIKDGFKEIGAVSTVLEKVATIVSYVRRSQSATEIMEGETRLQLRNATHKLRLLDTAHLTAHERNILEDLVHILTPFEEATDYTQGANIVTSSYVIPCIQGLKEPLETLSVTFNSRMLTALASSLDKRMAKFESQELFMLASTLDPRFKLKWCSDDDEQQRVKSILLEKAGSKVTTHEPEVPQQAVKMDATPSEPPSKRKKQEPEPSRLLSYLFTEESSTQTKISNPLDVEFSKYFSEPCLGEQRDALAFWKEHSATYPNISKLACYYLSVPASSGPVVRLFSIIGKFFWPERCRLSDSVFEKLMNIKCNGHLL
ncbi:PREDICTED: uncharacterized protein LOC105313654 [Amphimedon queenslandica]|uniref:HAT C-terminal dimerisation domain-containing protein n=1 Tax=Amphimedon queenslandica TaxID=400682 RepID=A0AAN0IP56_AMPQE|nr:PREDICTED: uncharacterized protein LOC105313654 [Amphimedon queenslandica]|eukprot:XP_011405551.1 PREDICTED: uncharacterized protein LOC105313654 [Amphimedon queenslandica]